MKTMMLASMIAAASATKMQPLAANADAIEGSYIVTLKSGTSMSSVLSKSVSNGVMNKISNVYSTVGGFSVADCDKATLQAIQDMDEVDFISPDQVMYALGSRDITDSGYWGLDRIDQPDLPLD